MKNEIKKGIIYIKPVYYNPAYKVDEEGIIYSKRNGEPMHPKIDQGYKRVWLLDDNGKLTPYSVHRCVGMTFLRDTYKEGYFINHKDGDKLNNNVDNLEWVTPAENCRHADEVLNKVKRGKDNPNAKLIVAVDPVTNKLKREYGAISEAARDIVGTDDFIINQRARNSITTAKKSKRPWKGFIWYERKEWDELNGEKD